MTHWLILNFYFTNWQKFLNEKKLDKILASMIIFDYSPFKNVSLNLPFSLFPSLSSIDVGIIPPGTRHVAAFITRPFDSIGVRGVVYRVLWKPKSNRLLFRARGYGGFRTPVIRHPLALHPTPYPLPPTHCPPPRCRFSFVVAAWRPGKDCVTLLVWCQSLRGEEEEGSFLINVAPKKRKERKFFIQLFGSLWTLDYCR